jgi:hypothetical protein
LHCVRWEPRGHLLDDSETKKLQGGSHRMKRITISLVVALLALATALVGTAAAKKPPKPSPTTTKKQNICHFTGKKYVAITVSKNAVTTHMTHHQDLIGLAVVPQGTKKAQKAAARAFCAALPILTTTRGGTPLTPTVTSSSTAVTGALDLRARLGQGQLCLSLTVNSTTVPITLSDVKVLSATNATIATLDLSSLGSLTSTTSPLHVSGCVDVQRALVKQILKTTGLKIQATLSSPAATLTATL